MDQECHPGGRPPKYQATYARQAKKLCQLGATDRDLAEVFGVCTRTVSRWQVEYREFCLAVKAGKAEADARVVRALNQRAVGYSFDSVKIMHHNGEASDRRLHRALPAGRWRHQALANEPLQG